MCFCMLFTPPADYARQTNYVESTEAPDSGSRRPKGCAAGVFDSVPAGAAGRCDRLRGNVLYKAAGGPQNNDDHVSRANLAWREHNVTWRR